MNKTLFFIAFQLIFLSAFTQKRVAVEETIKELSHWTKNVIPLESDSNCSSFIIRVKEKVKAHYHNNHTEVLYVLNGSAEMFLGDSIIKIKQGDYIYIPPKTIHAVKVTSMDWLEVISIQSPEFKGEDRIWVEKDYFEIKN